MGKHTKEICHFKNCRKGRAFVKDTDIIFIMKGWFGFLFSNYISGRLSGQHGNRHTLHEEDECDQLPIGDKIGKPISD